MAVKLTYNTDTDDLLRLSNEIHGSTAEITTKGVKPFQLTPDLRNRLSKYGVTTVNVNGKAESLFNGAATATSEVWFAVALAGLVAAVIFSTRS